MHVLSSRWKCASDVWHVGFIRNPELRLRRKLDAEDAVSESPFVFRI